MSLPEVEIGLESRRTRRRPKKRNSKPLTPKIQRVNAATLAAALQLKEQQRELFYSVIALSMKSGVLLIGIASLIKLGIISHHRVARYSELASLLVAESSQLSFVQKRFDSLFTLGGERRLMHEQDQWITPNRVRVIWR